MYFIPPHIPATANSFVGKIFDLNSLDFGSIAKDGSNRVASIVGNPPSTINASQSVDADKPVYSADVVNGKPMLLCDGSSDRMNLSGLIPITGDFTIFLVVYIPSQITSATGFQILMGKQATGDPRSGVSFGVTSIGDSETFTLFTTNEITLWGAYIKDNIPAGFNIIEAKLSGSTTTIFLNGVSKTVFLFNGGLSGAHTMNGLNRIFGHTTGGFFNGHQGRYLIHNNAFSSGDSSLMYQRLLGAWS